MNKMGMEDGRSGLVVDHSHPKALGTLSQPLNNRNNPEGSVKSDVDDYIESLWMLVMTRWHDTNGLLAGSRIRQESEELKPLTTAPKSQPMARLSDRKKSVAAYAPKGLNFISKEEGTTWVALEKRFNDLTMDTNGLLPRSRFWECIGMNDSSQEFAGELFDVLARRRQIKGDSINKEEMYEFWGQISDESFESRLQTFFDMIDKDADGRITKEEVREIISLSASINNLSNIKNKAHEYAAFFMEELDPDNLGYLMIENLEMLLLQAPKHNMSGESRKLSHMLSQKLKTTQSGNPIKRWYDDLRFPKVSINSLYGAPTQGYKNYKVVLLVGIGIGATPLINIVQDILSNIKAIEEEEENASTSTGKKQKKKRGPTNFKTTKAYFYWVTKEQSSFDWFKDVINEAAEMDKNGVIDMNTYCTSVYNEEDARSAFITMLQSLYHAKHGVDVVSGTFVKSHFSKPNWRNVYKRIAVNHYNAKIGVFYCGPPALEKDLKEQAHEFSSKSISTKFYFHKENPPSEDLQKWILSNHSRINNSTPPTLLPLLSRCFSSGDPEITSGTPLTGVSELFNYYNHAANNARINQLIVALKFNDVIE
ncbi:hypothetical protein LXL04_033658 [Taraxacum kok-saghyz]